MRQITLLIFAVLFITLRINAQCVSGDCKNGTGIYLYPSGAKYIGQFKDGEIHGVGSCYYTDGRKYQGEWISRYPHGQGTMNFSDGTKWTGFWKRGHPVDATGNIIEDIFAAKNVEDDITNIQSGCITGDCTNGEGVFAYPDGSKYAGHFQNGQPDGTGIFYFNDQERYEGSFSKGYFHGKGSFHHSDGTVTSGDWREGEYVGNPIIENGKIGCISGDCVNGRGTYIYKDGAAKYVGQFKSEMPEGKGAVYYANGERYVGEWARGSFNGLGTLYLLDGTDVRGFWKDGTYMGQIDPSAVSVAFAEADPPENEPVEKAEIIEEETPEVSEIQADENGAVVQKGEQEEVETPASVSDTKEDIQNARNIAKLKVWAVVVGVAAYNHMPSLRYTDDDAYRMFAFLKSPEGGALTDEQIRILVDEEATKQNIENSMRQVFNQAGPNDLVLLYFSGHGLKGSFLPIDYDGYNNKFYHEEVNSILSESPAKYKLCIADACHSGSLLAMKSGEISNALEAYYKSLAQADAGTALIMSSKSDETSLESSGLRQGVFSHFLIRGLKGEADSDKDRLVSIQELYDFINVNVRSYTGNRQSPLIKGDFDKRMTVAVVR